VCHGAGGLAAQYRFEARTGGSVILLGVAKMLLALLVGGSVVQVIALIAVGVMFAKGIGGLWLLIFIVMFTGSFAAAMGPVPWIVISEIFPTKIRGQAMSVATLVLWASCYIVSQTFPMLVDTIGNAKTFWIYALCSFAGLIFVVFVVPETKGKTLEEIEQSWSKSQGRFLPRS